MLGGLFQERGLPKRYLNFFVRSIQKQLKKVQNMNKETNEEEKGNIETTKGYKF